jgi:CRP/FNR family transcriptional regulator
VFGGFYEANLRVSAELDWIDGFPRLRECGESAVQALCENAQQVRLPAGAKAFEPGAHCDYYLLVVSGTVRVQQISESGREIVLYRVGGGESCVLTTACLLAHQPYAAEGFAESDVEAVIVPQATFHRLLGESSGFRDFVFESYASRIADLMLVVEDVAFRRVDVRLAERLLSRARGNPTIQLTHQDLAVELGTAREVISRQLKEFERRGWVRLARGSVAVNDFPALEQYASAV